MNHNNNNNILQAFHSCEDRNMPVWRQQ